MSTIKKRINVSLSKVSERAVAYLAKRDEMPEATKAAQLIELALELEEDQIWDAIASRRDTKNANFVPHSQAWR